jgi:ribosomal-protein-alanine N-acetyltransferase
MTVDQKITFRHMRKDDLDSVMVIDRLSFSLPWPKNAYLNDLNNNEKALLRVAEASTNRNDARVVGMIDLWLILDEAHLATLAVHPDYRGLGIATRLIDLVLLEAHELGAIKVMLEVRSSNYAAQALYKQFGFKVVHRRPRYYVDNREDALLMNLDDLDLWVKSSLQTELQKTTS